MKEDDILSGLNEKLPYIKSVFNQFKDQQSETAEEKLKKYENTDSNTTQPINLKGYVGQKKEDILHFLEGDVLWLFDNQNVYELNGKVVKKLEGKLLSKNQKIFTKFYQGENDDTKRDKFNPRIPYETVPTNILFVFNNDSKLETIMDSVDFQEVPSMETAPNLTFNQHNNEGQAYALAHRPMDPKYFYSSSRLKKYAK
mmetsp:Transcript_11145/g.16448  ORF Transcript_11145/g.16448 Transcript_11145/m.16448 type:complete len:199 (+) Transcript_11145:21-617(+)